MKLNVINPNRTYWNIVKGIGILCVVIGHACDWAHNYVYLFHLPLFFFISGFMYSEEKYGDRPYLNLKNKFKTSWLKYVVIYEIIMLLHNPLVRLGMMPVGAQMFNLRDLLEAMAYVLLGTANELMGGTLWFVPVLVLSSVILGFVIMISRFFQKQTGSGLVKFTFQAFCMVIFVQLGWYLCGDLLPANIQVVFLVMPFQWIGYLLRNYGADYREHIYISLSLACGVMLYEVSTVHTLDLIFGNLYIGMYVAAFMGIYFCLGIGKLLYQLKSLTVVFSELGKDSFWIMAFHFPIIKILDYMYGKMEGIPQLEYLVLPHAFSQLWPCYLVMGIVIPVIGCMLYRRITLRVHV